MSPKLTDRDRHIQYLNNMLVALKMKCNHGRLAGFKMGKWYSSSKQKLNIDFNSVKLHINFVD